MAVVALAALVYAPTAGATGPTAVDSGSRLDRSATAQSAMDSARAVRVGIEHRLAGLRAERSDLLTRQEQIDRGALEIAEDLAAARRSVREYAVSAYIDGGEAAMVSAAMNPEQRAALAWRRDLAGGQTVSASEAVSRYTALEKANDPDRRAVAARVDDLNSLIDQVHSDALQAAALERDAEHELALVRARTAARNNSAARTDTLPTDTVPTDTVPTNAVRTNSTGKANRTDRANAVAGSSTAVRGSRAPAPSAPSPRSRVAPAVTPGPGSAPSDEEAAVLARIRNCESQGNYSIVSASGRYRGAYQFDARTWAAVGGSGDPAAASPAEQDHRALILLRQRGRRAWPSCA